MLSLVEESARDRLPRVALLLRFSPMLEFVKNYGMAKLDVRFRYFVGAVALHRLLVTVLWSYKIQNIVFDISYRAAMECSPDKNIRIYCLAHPDWTVDQILAR